MDTPPAFGDLSKIVTLLREISCYTDPQAMVRAYAKRSRELIPVDRSISLSRRDLAAPLFRVTRYSHWAQEINPWQQRDQLPLLRGGLLGELLYAGEPRILQTFSINSDDPARDMLDGMGSLVAIPHFDSGEAVNMVVHLRKEPNAFDPAMFPEFVLLSGLFGRAMKGLVLADERDKAQQELKDQYHSVAQLSDTVIEQARELKNHSKYLEARVRQRTAELEAAHDDAIYILAAASEEKDHDTADHLKRMQQLTAEVCRAMGLSAEQTRQVAQAAILHDVGKLHVPDGILKKRGPLTSDERTIMQDHTMAGQRILPDRPYFSLARAVARSHHENWDGTGYPDRLAGDAIPIEARIVHLVDVYDALTNKRPYKEAWSIDQARNYLRQQRGVMFDPNLVEAFFRIE